MASEGRRRSSSTSRTSGAADRASFAFCSREGLSGRASSVLSRKSVAIFDEDFSSLARRDDAGMALPYVKEEQRSQRR